MYMSCVLCIKTGERDKTFFCLVVFDFCYTLSSHWKRNILSIRTLKAPCCPREHETFVYSNLFNCFQFVFSYPRHPPKEKKTQNFSSQQCFWAWFRLLLNADVGNATTAVKEFMRVRKERNLFPLWGEEEECEEFSPFFVLQFGELNSIR